MAHATEDLYRGEAGQRYQQQKRAVPAQAAPWVARLRADKLQPYISSADTVVELGAGLGWNLANLCCLRRIATDLEDFLPIDLKRDGVEFVADSKSLRAELADVLICHHVLEHVENPPEMLSEAKRLLRPGGKLLLFVPYEKEGKYCHFDPSEPNHHLYSWNAQTLGNLVASRGFTIHECRIAEFGYDRFASKVAIRFHLGENGFRLIRRLIHLLRPGREVRLAATKEPVREKA